MEIIQPGGPIEGPWAITRPGTYDGMPDTWYHRDPVVGGSISHSGVKDILKCPAIFRSSQDVGRPDKDHYDDGHILHTLVLGNGGPIEVVKSDDWRTKAAQEERKQARARGAVPVLEKDYGPLRAQAASLRNKPQTAGIFEPGAGIPERVYVWYDDTFGVWCRSKVDWSYRDADGRLVMVDYKSTTNASPGAISRWMFNFGYYTQHPFYHRGACVLGEEDPRFLFVFQEKVHPYIATVAELAPEDVAWGMVKVRKGLDIYTQCLATNTWPEYSTEIVPTRLPRYADIELTRAWESGALDVREDA